MMRHAALVACLVAEAGAAQTCGETLAGPRTTLENSRYVVAFATTPRDVAVGEHFVVDFAVCPRGDARAPQAVRVDATMPEHRHGMNYRAGVVSLAPGMYRAEGLLLHMRGRWELTFDVVTGERTERLAGTILLQ